VRADGDAIIPLLRDVLKLLPLDATAAPCAVMAVPAGVAPPPVQARFLALAQGAQPSVARLEQIERFAFYERARRAFAVVATGERTTYANLILTKGVLLPTPRTAKTKAASGAAPTGRA
jgi:L-fucose mutarotase